MTDKEPIEAVVVEPAKNHRCWCCLTKARGGAGTTWFGGTWHFNKIDAEKDVAIASRGDWQDVILVEAILPA